MNKKEFVAIWTILMLGVAFWVLGVFLPLKPIAHFICGSFTAVTILLMSKAYKAVRF